MNESNQIIESISHHTAGPYFYERQSEGVDDLWEIKAQSDQRTIASIVFWDDDPEWMARTEANARLLAASPDMLGALKQVIEAFQRLNFTFDHAPVFNAIRSARFAVALAEGTIVVRGC